MSTNTSSANHDGFRKAKDLTTVVKFEKDDSQEGRMRVNQARALVGELILSGCKRGRPNSSQEDIHEAA